MFIANFSVEDWQGNQNRSSLQPAKCWQNIEAAIQELDGQQQGYMQISEDTPNDLQPLAHPYFRGAWICQG